MRLFQRAAILKHYAEDLGFEYLSASNKEEFLMNVDRFTTPEHLSKPLLFEVFTNSEDESKALFEIYHIDASEEIKK